MKKSIAMAWVAELRSGKIKQVNGFLRTHKGMCCLGVLCNLHAQAHPKFAKTQTDFTRYGGKSGTPPIVVRDWASMKTVAGEFPYSLSEESPMANSLVCLNDTYGWSFKKIANFIEKNYMHL